MNATRLTVLCMGIAVAIGGVWLFGEPLNASRSNADPAVVAASPPATAQTSQDVAQVRRVSPSGDANQLPKAKAGGAMFETSRDCYFAKNQVDAARSVIKACQSLPQIPLTETQRTACLGTVATNEATIHELTDAVASCPSDVASARYFYEATKAAAAQGNADAQACYVQSFFQSNGARLTYSQQEIDDYRRDAPRYITEGLARGDWRIVSLLARGGSDERSGLLPLIVKHDVPREYVMNRLLQLGAEGDYAHQLEASIQAHYLSASTTHAPPLTPEQVAEGNREAQDLYRKSFDHEPLIKAPPTVCAKE